MYFNGDQNTDQNSFLALIGVMNETNQNKYHIFVFASFVARQFYLGIFSM